MIVFALALAAPAQAAPAAPASLADALRRQGMSPGGIAIMQQRGQAAQPMIAGYVTRAKAVQAQVVAAAKSGDLAALDRALAARDALNAQFAATRTRESMAALRQLPQADRQVLLRGMVAEFSGAPQR